MMHKAKKSLGQNFLKSEKALLRIFTSGDLKPGDTVLEIGPGLGALTSKMLESSATIIAVEKDKELFEFLNDKFKKETENKRLILINQDILEFSIPNDVKSYKLIANIPYNITGAIFKKFLEEESSPTKMVLLVQKEVAERIIAKDSKESILSISIKVYGEPKYIMTVGRGSFSPSPNVDSAIIEISNINKNNFPDKKTEKIFFEILKAGFTHKRKLVISNLITSFGHRDVIRDIFVTLEIDLKSRAEDLKVQDWLNIEKQCFKIGILQ